MTKLHTSNSSLEGLIKTVVRITAKESNGDISRGTGFFYCKVLDNETIPLIVSNKHVLVGKEWLRIEFGISEEGNVRKYGTPVTFHADNGKIPIFEHQDESVDLAAIPFLHIVAQLNSGGAHPHFLMLNKNSIIKSKKHKFIHAGTSALMVGYPNGLMDDYNYTPFVRQGILSTPYYLDYQGKRDFTIDIAAYGGSSGSPVFSFFNGYYIDDNGNRTFTGSSSIELLGVLHSGPIKEIKAKLFEGEDEIYGLAAVSQLTLNLGICARAELIEEIPI